MEFQKTNFNEDGTTACTPSFLNNFQDFCLNNNNKIIDLSNIVGNLSDLNTINKDNLVKSINEINEKNFSFDGWYKLDASAFNYKNYDETVKTGILNSTIDFTSKMSLGMKVRFKQNEDIKYGFITKITSSQLTIYMGNEYKLETGLVSDFYFSMLKVPYGFPMEREAWDIVKEFSSPSQISNPTSGTYYKLSDVDIIIPMGLWEIGWQGNTYPMRNGTGTNEQQSGLSTTTNSFTHPELNAANFSNTTQCMLGMFKSHEYNIATKTTFNFVVRTTQTNMTSIGLYSGTTYGYSKLFAKCLYL